MAEMEFKHNVPDVGRGATLPEYKGEGVKPEVISSPDYQGALNKFGADTNILSQIGSTIAAKSSNAIAQRLGNELGKTPHGDLSPSFTDFDKTMAESYKNQAHATLGLKANELITSSNIALAKLPRITPDVIAKTNQQISLGLQNIFKDAPTEIQPNLEYTYGNQMLSQTAELSDRMLREQKQDRKANTAASSQTNAETAYSLAINGNYKAAENLVKTTEKINNADTNANISDKNVAKTHVDTVRIAALSGRTIHDYEVARSQKKDAEYLRSLADKKPDDISNTDFHSVVNNLFSYIGDQNKLRLQDQNIAMAKFNVALAENPLSPNMPAQIAELNEHLDPYQQLQASLAYTKAVKAIQKQNDGVAKALAVYTNINEFPKLSAENKNLAWETTYKDMLRKPENIAAGMTEATAKLYAASAAPSMIPAYNDELNTKARTAVPANLEEVGQAVNYMRTHNLGQNINIGEKEETMLDGFSRLRQTMDPVEAAQKMHEQVYNQSSEQKKANEQALATYYKSQMNKNKNIFALVKEWVDTPNYKLRNLPGYTQKAKEVFETFFNTSNGDEVYAAQKSKEFMDRQYSASNVNGETELMYQPIENIPGIPHDATGAIQSDIVDQANTKFKETKKLYDEGKQDHWFEVRQKISADEAKTSKRILDALNEGRLKNPITNAVFDIHNKRKEYANHLAIVNTYNAGQPMTIIKHNRSGKDEVFEGMVQANPWGVATGNPSQPVAGGYDFLMKTQNGGTAIPTIDPLNSSIQINPRVDRIKSLYLETQGLSTLQYAMRPQDAELEKLIAAKGAMGARL